MNAAPVDANLLTALDEPARHDLARLNYPAPNWVPPSIGPDGKPLLDVLVVGAGMCGQTAAFALLREGIRNLRVIDAAPFGREGPWGTYARMETLRSPKHLTSPDLGVASLTFRAWYEAQHGAAGWDALYKIPTRQWLDYLHWVRRISAIPVENDTALRALEPAGALLRAQLHGPRGDETLYARKVVLALGRDGSGAPRLPRFPSFDPASMRAHDPAQMRAHPPVFHSADAIDFAALRGRRVGVLGAGSSAFDNAGTALEAGAAQVSMFARRAALPQVNKSKWASFPGFFHGFIALDDTMRWKFLTHVFDEQVPPPFESVLRCDQHAAFALHLGEAWSDLAPAGPGVRVTTAKGTYAFDAVIIATGFDVDMMARAEVAALRDQVQMWRDKVPAEEAARHPEEARFPYLGPGFELIERSPGALPAARHVHLFNWGCAMSHGQLAGDIPGLGTGATRLAQALARDLFLLDQHRLYEALLAHAEPELKPTRHYIPKT